MNTFDRVGPLALFAMPVSLEGEKKGKGKRRKPGRFPFQKMKETKKKKTWSLST
jgi:hypothetical protein